MADGALLAGRVQVILDDILWVATLAQVRSAIAFYRHLLLIVKQSETAAPSSSKGSLLAGMAKTPTVR